ncbi:hypothetical protein ACTQXY_15275 [Faecalimonas sp. LCP19S3_D12]
MIQRKVSIIGYALEIVDKLDEKITDKMDKIKKFSILMVVAAMDMVYGDEEIPICYV